jgi:hypothetical protein
MAQGVVMTDAIQLANQVRVQATTASNRDPNLGQASSATTPRWLPRNDAPNYEPLDR